MQIITIPSLRCGVTWPPDQPEASESILYDRWPLTWGEKFLRRTATRFGVQTSQVILPPLASSWPVPLGPLSNGYPWSRFTGFSGHLGSPWVTLGPFFGPTPIPLSSTPPSSGRIPVKEVRSKHHRAYVTEERRCATNILQGKKFVPPLVWYQSVASRGEGPQK